MLSSLLGLVLVGVTVGEYSLRLILGRAARSTRGYDPFILFAVVVSGAAVYFHHAAFWKFGVTAGVALGWFVLTRTELRFKGGPPGSARAKVGDPLPAFQAKTLAGEPFGVAELQARAPALLVVYRGHW